MKKLVLVAGSVLLVFQISLLAVNAIHKLNRQLFVSELERVIKLNEGRLLPGTLEIIGSRIPKPVIGEYEVNYLMYNSTGRAEWLARIGDKQDAKFSIPCFIRLNKAYQFKYIYNYQPSHNLNHSIVEIDIRGYEGLENAFRNVFGINNSHSVEITNIFSKLKQDKYSNESCN